VAATLLSIVELGGYPNFEELYRAAGYRVMGATGVRKALAALREGCPQVVVAEFNFQSDFRDRTSSLESLLATLQARCPGTRVIVFYEPEQAAHLARLQARFTLAATIPFPVDPQQLRSALAIPESPS
jgi:DNA-binding NtrC family response regulator